MGDARVESVGEPLVGTDTKQCIFLQIGLKQFPKHII